MSQRVLRGLSAGSVTKMVVMDHMDWFDPAPVRTPWLLLHPSRFLTLYHPQPSTGPLDTEIEQMHRVLASNGSVFWRSAARKPWYIANFKHHGFRVTALAIRNPGSKKPIDRVNMYASFYRADKL
jgi:betaine lipid synthase